MPKIDFSKIDEVDDFSPLPDGDYLCKLAEIEEATTQHGDDLWKLRFQVLEGEHARRLIFDNMVFSAAALKRVKLICSRLGLDVSGEVELTPEMLLNKSCILTVTTEAYEDSEGKTKKRNVVPFAGYERADSGAAEAPVSQEDESEMPF